MGSYKESRLPAAYQEVAYLGNTGTQYIDTGITPLELPKFEITWSPTATGSNYVCGARIQGGNLYCGILGSATGNRINSVIARTTTNISLYYEFNTRRTLNYWYKNLSAIEYDETQGYRGKFTINTLATGVEEIGYTNYYNNVTFEASPVSLMLFAVASDNIHPGVRISSYKYYANFANTQPTLNMVPCYRKADNKPGMYDLVTNTFFVNAGTGEFTVGPDVN